MRKPVKGCKSFVDTAPCRRCGRNFRFYRKGQKPRYYCKSCRITEKRQQKAFRREYMKEYYREYMKRYRLQKSNKVAQIVVAS